MAESTRYCTACGAALRAGVRYCTTCGQAVPVHQDADAPPAVPVAPASARDAAAAASLPSQWEPVGALGRGATGTVLLARDRATGHLRAIKRVAAGVGDRTIDGSPPAELLALARIRHQNVVPVLEVIPDATGTWVAMAYVEGATLAQLLAYHGRLSPEQAVGVLDGALAGLAELHRAGFVHGDVSPANILVDRDGVSYLTDLGQAGPAGQMARGGTPGYLSPEALQARPLHPSADVYAAAQVLRHCLTGEPPAADDVAAARAQLAGPQRLDQVPAPIAAVLARALALDPQYRPADAATFRAQLAHAADQAFTGDWRTRSSVAGLASALGVEGTAIGTAMAGSTTGPAAGSASPGGAQLGGPPLGPVQGDSTTSASSLRSATPVAKVTGVVATHKVAAVVIAGIVAAVAAGTGVGMTVSRSPGPSASTPPTAPPPATAAASAPTTTPPTTTTPTPSTSPAAPSRPRAWTAAPSITGPSTEYINLTDLACPSSRSCLVAGGIDHTSTNTSSAAIYRVAADGTGPSPLALPDGLTADELGGITCPTATQCWAVGDGAVLHSTDGGTTWAEQSAPVGTSKTQSITCPTTSSCLIASTGVTSMVRTEDGGSHWSVIGHLPATLVQHQIACSSPRRCWAVLSSGSDQQSGALWTSTDGGGHWSMVRLPSSPDQVFSISCPKPTACAVAAAAANPQGQITVPEVLTTNDRGSHWEGHRLPSQPIGTATTGPPSGVGPMAIACSSPAMCVVLLGNNSSFYRVDRAYSTEDGWTSAVATTLPASAQFDIPALTCLPTGACLGMTFNSATGPPLGVAAPLLASPSP